MFLIQILVSFLGLTLCLAQTPAPAMILKQINRQNEDGSYSYGYEGSDGSYKVETKYPNGQVAGKYGYIDADGEMREVQYGASKERGFEPTGTGINVPEPSVTGGNGEDYDDGQYHEDPRIYYESAKPLKQSKFPAPQQNFQYVQPQAPLQQNVQYTKTSEQAYQVPPNTFSFSSPATRSRFNSPAAAALNQPEVSYSVTYKGSGY